VYINNDLDVVTTRLQAREMAKQLGFGTADQARISLAASELARILTWQTGEIILSQATENGDQGLQIECTLAAQSSSLGTLSQSLASVRKLVDKSVVETQDNQSGRVVLVKWLK
jgi:hypothetical protein